MDEQTAPTEPVTTSPDPVVNTPIIEPPQTETPQPQAEPVPALETGPQGPLPFSRVDDHQENLVAHTEAVPEPTQTTRETPTPQLPAVEALPETTPQSAPQGAVATAEAPKVGTSNAVTNSNR